MLPRDSSTARAAPHKESDFTMFCSSGLGKRDEMGEMERGRGGIAGAAGTAPERACRAGSRDRCHRRCEVERLEARRGAVALAVEDGDPARSVPVLQLEDVLTASSSRPRLRDAKRDK
jgi:hypothetical protein